MHQTVRCTIGRPLLADFVADIGDQYSRRSRYRARHMTSELIEMSKRLAEQTTATERLRAELDDFKSRAWWWQHSTE
jgi:hypothetical protein